MQPESTNDHHGHDEDSGDEAKQYEAGFFDKQHGLPEG
jgi:hypothetical protein